MSLSLQSANGVRIAVLEGAVDNSSGSDLVTTIKSSVEKGATIILDCTLVPGMDVAGFRHLLALHRWSQQGNGRLILAGMGPEAWALVVENHCENTFESSPSVAAAMQSAGLGDEGPDAASHDAPPLADDYSALDVPPPPLSPEDSGIFTNARKTGGAGPWMASSDSAGATGGWDTPSTPNFSAGTGSGEDGWDSFNKRQSSHPDDGDGGGGRGKSRTLLYAGLAAAAVILIAGGFWLKSYLSPPVITVDQSSISTDEGKTLPDVTITVQNGILDADTIKLPNGVVIVEEGEQDGTWVYTLGGLAKQPGTYPVELSARRGGREAEPVEVSIEIKQVKKVEWLFSSSLPLQEKRPIDKQHYSSVVKGAKDVKLRWGGEDPKGLEVKPMTEPSTTWQLTGTPETSGSFNAEFHAINESGEEETKTFLIQVKAAPPPPPPPAPPAAISQAPVTPASSTSPSMPVQAGTPQSTAAAQSTPPATADVKAEEDDAALDDRMRTFLMERIEKANDHFDTAEKFVLRTIIGNLKDARQVATVKFDNGAAKAKPNQIAQLKDALNESKIKKLLDDPDCQILIVGYASKSGSHAYNIKLSRARARHVNDLMRREIGRDADLCGDYGPTDIISVDDDDNRVVEVYAGIIEISKSDRNAADKFKNDFNKNHGGR